ncbi:unnamed protein product [Parnassius mnemosyne]|uniref:Uncharacterized protein n=1 Tax=Parnassius mnemosyne TaxID=213953 RepID=A0AAV1M0H9_9NEOP
MPQDHSFYNCLLQCINQNRDTSILLNFAISMQYATKKDLYKILELLHATNDMQAQVKLFSILAAYMVSNGAHSDVIIKFNPLYDKICAVLSRGLPLKTNVTLNFLSALLYTDNECELTKRSTLVVYAQNMLRSSGCLTSMSNLFTSCMLHQDTWGALCRCLVEACRCHEANQNYCSHLIPLCVQRCQHGNEYLFELLQSLLSNNEHNIRLFYECGGKNIFAREFLKYDQCLQLLNTIVLNTVFKNKLLEETNILYNLEHLKQLYGPMSQVGQWVTIILYNMNLSHKGFKKHAEKNKTNIFEPKSDILFQNECDNNDDTTELFQNVINEVFNFEAIKNSNTHKISKIYKRNIKNNIQTEKYLNKTKVLNMCKTNNSILRNNENYPHRIENPPFSFLQRDNSDRKSMNYNYCENQKDFSITKSIYNQIDSSLEKSPATLNYTELYAEKKVTNTKEVKKESISDFSFRPQFVSTPKNIYRNVSRTNISHISLRKSPINKSYKNGRLQKSHIERIKTDCKKVNISCQQRTIGARLFDAINESCTTIIKSVRNVFKTKKIEKPRKETFDSSNIGDVDIPHCSNSFTNYMRKREALLNEQNSDLTSYSFHKECTTCNDTLTLQGKFANDDFLRQTVKKLKLGINLYGCDFKKISKALWPHESYMTPSVLYNLYRKLIIK